MPRNKYKAIATEVDGIRFASRKEARRYQDLMILQRAHKITELELQPKFQLVVNGVKIGRYTGDFKYYDNDKGEYVIEDTKGYPSRDYVLRKKLMLALHGITIFET